MNLNREFARFRSSLRFALVLSVLVLAPAVRDAKAQASSGIRRPRGIYAVIDIDGYIDVHAGMTQVELHADLIGLYGNVLDNPAVSGLAIQMGWHRLNPNPPTSAQPYDWSYLDDAFSSVSAWNAANPSRSPKTIQMILFPGFFTPQWVFAQIASCDGLFQTPPQTPTSCGKVTVTGFGEPHEGTVLPLPWDPIYKSSYRTFVTAFAAHFGSNPALASIAVAGPTAASEEILLPATGNTPAQAQFGGITPEQMWLKLLAFAYPGQPVYQKSDQAFVDEWIAAIDMYAGITAVRLKLEQNQLVARIE